MICRSKTCLQLDCASNNGLTTTSDKVQQDDKRNWICNPRRSASTGGCGGGKPDTTDFWYMPRLVAHHHQAANRRDVQCVEFSEHRSGAARRSGSISIHRHEPDVPRVPTRPPGAAEGKLTVQHECRRRLAELTQQHTVTIVSGKFMRSTRDSVRVFQCRRVVTTIRTTSECHCDIPVHGPQPFANVATRILRSASPIVPCAREFPMWVEGAQQQWWRIDPAVIKEPAPQTWRGIQQPHPPTHMDRPSVLYNDSERSQWATLQAVPVYQDMIRNQIELGSCQGVS